MAFTQTRDRTPQHAPVPVPTQQRIDSLASTYNTGTSQGTADQQNALAYIQTVLDQYGLGGLSQWAWQEIVSGKSESQVLLDMQQTPEFKAAFPEIQQRLDAGLPAISPADVINYRTQARQIMQAAGLPADFYDQPSDFSPFIVGDMSLQELSDRVNLAKTAAYEVPQTVRDHLANYYGLDEGHLAAAFLDPTRAEPVLARQFAAAQAGGAAATTGFGDITRSQAENLADLGVTASQAQSGFSQLAHMRQLMNPLPGENTTGISPDQQMQAEFGGNAAQQDRILAEQRRRLAPFAGGGSFAQGQSGTSVGSATGQ